MALFVSGLGAQTAPEPSSPPDPPSAAAAPAGFPWSWKGTELSGMIDAYTDVNLNHPASGFNGLRNFDFRSDTAHVNLGKIAVEHAPAPFGFRFDLGFGQALYALHAADPGPDAMKYVEQAYVSFKPKALQGFELDFGKFVTNAGAEVIETKDNWNYSRSLLFSWAFPAYHMGLRASMPVGGGLTAGFQVINGFNNDRDNNGAKTLVFTSVYRHKKFSWNQTFFTGREKDGTAKGRRNLYDTVMQYDQNPNLSYSVNYDYGRDKNNGPGSQMWNGVSFMARRAFGKFAVIPRAEFFNDSNGFTTGTAQKLTEFTLTGEHKTTDWLITRAEFRHDRSDKPFFEGQNGAYGKTQTTFLLGMIAYFGPKK